MGEALKARAGMVALTAAATLAFLALAVVPGAKAATVGDPVAVDFNHVGVSISAAILGDVNQMILKPSDGAGELELRGSYTNTSGDFTVPKNGGLTFPDIDLNFDGVIVQGSLELAENSTGNYNESTGAMTLNPKIALTLGVSDAGAISGGVLPDGPLKCKLTPINAYLSTGYQWPAPGDAFTPGTFTEGAVAGAWTVAPGFETIEGNSCFLLAGIINPVGGLWLGNYAVESADLPSTTATKPGVGTCPAGLLGNGTNCTAVQPRAILGSVSFAKPKATAKRGKTVSLIVKVRNTGNAAGTASVALSSSSKAVTVPKSVKVTVPAGKTGQATVRLKAGKKAGKATITAKLAGKSAKATVTVK
jgi:hypothetical protein